LRLSHGFAPLTFSARSGGQALRVEYKEAVICGKPLGERPACQRPTNVRSVPARSQETCDHANMDIGFQGTPLAASREKAKFDLMTMKIVKANISMRADRVNFIDCIRSAGGSG
jgi:hypothetical protein